MIKKYPDLGSAFISEVEGIIQLLHEQPKIGQIIEEEFSRVLLARFPFSLTYRIKPESIWIIAVAHQHRRPGYWKERINR